MPLFGDDVYDALALLPKAVAQTLEREGFARAGAAAEPDVAVGVLVIVIRVQKSRRTVIHVQSQKDAVAVTELIGRKGKGRRHTACEDIAARFALKVWVYVQNNVIKLKI